MISFRNSLLVAACALAPMRAVLSQAGASPQAVVALDFVRAKPGERARLIRFFESNWAAVRATLLPRNVGVVGYRMLVSADTASAWDVVLETIYADSAAYERREQIFQPVLAARTKILIDGKDRPDLGDIVTSRITRIRSGT
jgi:hypothetical protein